MDIRREPSEGELRCVGTRRHHGGKGDHGGGDGHGGDGHGGDGHGGNGDGGGSDDDGGDWYTEEAGRRGPCRRRASCSGGATNSTRGALRRTPTVPTWIRTRSHAAHAVQQAERAVAREQQAKRERKALRRSEARDARGALKRIVQQDGQQPPSKKSDEERAAAGGAHMTAQASRMGGATTAGRPSEGEKEERGSRRGGGAPSAQALAAAGWAAKIDPRSGRTYYVHFERQVTQWQAPEMEEVMAESVAASPKPAEARALSLFAAVDEAESSDGPSAKEVEERRLLADAGLVALTPEARCRGRRRACFMDDDVRMDAACIDRCPVFAARPARPARPAAMPPDKQLPSSGRGEPCRREGARLL